MAVEGGEVCSSRAEEKWSWVTERKGKAYELLFIIPSFPFILFSLLCCSTHVFFIVCLPEYSQFTAGRIYTVPYFLGILSTVKRNFVSPRPSKKTSKLLIISLPHNTSKRENPPQLIFLSSSSPTFGLKISPPIPRYDYNN